MHHRFLSSIPPCEAPWLSRFLDREPSLIIMMIPSSVFLCAILAFFLLSSPPSCSPLSPACGRLPSVTVCSGPHPSGYRGGCCLGRLLPPGPDSPSNTIISQVLHPPGKRYTSTIDQTKKGRQEHVFLKRDAAFLVFFSLKEVKHMTRVLSHQSDT